MWQIIFSLSLCAAGTLNLRVDKQHALESSKAGIPRSLGYSEFVTDMQGTTEYGQYVSLTNTHTAGLYIGILFQDAARCWSINKASFGTTMCGLQHGRVKTLEMYDKITPESTTTPFFMTSRHRDRVLARYKTRLYTEIQTLWGLENANMQKRKQYIDNLYSKAQRSQLSQKLATHKAAAYTGVVPTADTSPGAAALAWVRDPTNKGGHPVVSGTDSAIIAARSWGVTAISKIYPVICASAKDCRQDTYRSTQTTGVKYTSSVGGVYLFKYAMRKLGNPPVASVDNALFAMGALGASQLFPDGNKRTARALYAIAYSAITPMVAFVGPDHVFMQELFHM